MVFGFDRIKHISVELVNTCFIVSTKVNSAPVRRSLIDLATLIQTTFPKYTAYGFFILSKPILLEFLSAMVSYIVVILQLRKYKF